MRNRIQTFDSSFSLYRADGITLHKAGVPTETSSTKGVSTFNDHVSTY